MNASTRVVSASRKRTRNLLVALVVAVPPVQV